MCGNGGLIGLLPFLQWWWWWWW